MLLLKIPPVEYYDEENDLFSYSGERTIQLEHSLISISKWESRWHKPYLAEERRTMEESIDYIRCMTITPNVPDEEYQRIGDAQMDEVSAYILDPMSATEVSRRQKKEGVARRKDVVTSEKIYSWMIGLNIPLECQKWHLNRLFALIELCDAQNAPPKKKSKRELIEENKALNQARRAQANSKG